MDTATLARLGESAEEAAPPPDSEPVTPSDLGKQENETPETLIQRGVIPEGYTRDPRTKEIRPKKTRGRPRTGTAAPKPDKPIQRGTDEPPDSSAKGKVSAPAPRWSKGVIAVGMAKLYRRTGRIIKSLDKDIGQAVIECADDCGEAWDELARTNPRVRAFLLKLIGGGAWGSIIMAHAPIGLAIVMKDGIRKHIPFMKLLDSLLTDDEDGSADISKMLGDIKPEDLQQVMSLFGNQFGNMAMRAAQNGTE